jgi:hypothetical protein
MPWNAPELDTQQLFPDEGQSDLETDLMFLQDQISNGHKE